MADNKRNSRELPMLGGLLQSIDFRLFNKGLKKHADSTIEDLVLRNGYAAGIINASQNAIVGGSYRLQLRPDYTILGITPEQSRELAAAVEREFHLYGTSSNNWIDASRKRSFTQILREAIHSDFIYGEFFLIRQWRPNFSGNSTCFQIINPARISNPHGTRNSATLREGVVLNEYGEATGYWIRTKHPVDVDTTQGTWDFVPRFNEFGVEQVLHFTDQLQADQTRGVSRFVSVIDKLTELDTYEGAELDAAILGALYTMVIVSEHGQQSAHDTLGLNSEESLKTQLEMSSLWHEQNPVTFNKSRIPHLFPGEDLRVVGQPHPTNAYGDFTSNALRHTARGVGMSVEEVTGDFSRTSYSSARASMEIGDRNNIAKRFGYVDKIANKILQLFMYELIIKDQSRPPEEKRLPDFGINFGLTRNVDALLQCKWLGAPRIVIDGAKQARAQAEMLTAGTTTLSAIAASQSEDWEELLMQRKREMDFAQSIGLPLSLVTNDPEFDPARDEIDEDPNAPPAPPEDDSSSPQE